MRNAERHVAQGKIRAAISEYRAVVENDPRDIATLNMLGDLYAKSSEKREAVECYLQVAEHYSTQGFAQKAIAIYNKISRIQPDSIEVSAKLAELHKVKGSLSEARSHYTTLAEHYQNTGRRIEALAIWKQIALLDPNNTEVCMSLADSYLREGQRDDAAEAYAEAGVRFSRQGRHEDAIRALMKGYDIRPTDLRILGGLIKAQTALGRAQKAVSLLEEILDSDPYNRDILYLLIECCIDSQNARDAEKAVIKLVEIEPANYPKFLDLIRIYLNVNDAESAARILSMSAEYLLAGGQSDECGKWVREILERDPKQLSGLRLLVRFCSWMKDEAGILRSLERLYASASEKGSIDDERFALSQLVVLRPHEEAYRLRLDSINAEFGGDDEPVDMELLKSMSLKDDGGLFADNYQRPEPDEFVADGLERNGEIITAHVLPDSNENGGDSDSNFRKLSLADEHKLQKEIESIRFFFENGYVDLAQKALAELVLEFGEQVEISNLRSEILGEEAHDLIVELSPDAALEPEQLENREPVAEEPRIDEPVVETEANTLGIDEIRQEFGLDEPDTAEGDYDTHYHTAVAYQEMGLIEEAIREFQDAINLVKPKDGTRRFYQCANLLGHCFLQNNRPNHAITWINRALETPQISDEEYQALWYELGVAYEAAGDVESSAKYFEQVYAENIDFRDVAERVKNLVTVHT